MRHRKRIIFVFCYSFKVLVFSKKSNKATLPNTKTFSTVKLVLYAQSLCLLLHNIFLVFNISDNCWKSSHNLWTLPNHNSMSLEGLGFRACCSTSAQSPTTAFWKPIVLGIYMKVFPFEMMDKSLHIKLVIVSLLEHNLNQQISHFRSFNSTHKVNTVLVHLRVNLTWPYQRQVVGLFSLQFRWNFIFLHVLSKNYMMLFFRKWPSPGLNKQSYCWKKLLWLPFLPDTATQRQVIDFFYHHDLAKISFTSMC